MALDFTPAWMTEELSVLADTAERFAIHEMSPSDVADRERGHVLPTMWRHAGELGLLCMDIPEEYGGGGGDYRHEAVFLDAMARRGLWGLGTGVHSIVAHYFLNHGTEEQKRRYLPRMARGELVGAIAMSEPGAGSDLQGVRSRAVRRGEEYVLNGSKTFISNGFMAGVVLVVCKTDPTQGARGTSILIVEPAEAPGFRVGKILDKIGMKAQDTAELFFDDVVVPAENLLGGCEGQGFIQLMSDLPYERTGVGVVAVANMIGAYEATLDYVRQRRAFGQTIGEFQNTRFKLSEIATTIRVARTFVDHCIKQLVSGNIDNALASMVKMWTSEQNARVIDECQQLHGGYGYMNEYLVARLYGDIRMQRIAGGTSEIMKELISRSL